MLPPKQRFYAFIFFCLLIVVSSFGGSLIWKPFGSILLPIPLLIAGWFLRRMFIPVMSGQTRIQLTSLALLYSTSILYFIPANPISAFIVSILNSILQQFGFAPVHEPLWYSLVAQVIVSVTIIVLNIIWRSRDVTDTPNDPSGLLPSLADPGFNESLKVYCKSLEKSLDRYDNDVNWSDRELTPLEAEVETERNNRLRPKIVRDLVAAIQRDRISSVFVVLGDPGSGKSVSLRRLVRILCKQAENTGVVPVYVNLREYPSQRKVTTDLLWKFAKEKAYQQTGRDGRNFLDTFYEKLRKNRRLFFVFDSFDELPAVLDSDERSDSHRKISAEFDRFFTQEIQSCRAVLASRHFRAPVGVKGTRLILRPFRESQIRSAMKTWLLGRGIDTEKYIRRLFREKPQLVPLLRNPFTAELIAEYTRINGGEELPDNLFEVFDSYIHNRLESDIAKLRELDLIPQKVRDGAAIIAKSMYQRGNDGNYGLEAEVNWVTSQLESVFSRKQAKSIIEALAYTHMARVGGRVTSNRRFSFVHRRFAEFFVVEASRVGENFLDFKGIPTDSRWRDCLVMYCGISELPIRRKIATKDCWETIEKSKDKLLNGDFTELPSAVNSLRFLTDAFRSDFNAIEGFQSKLGTLVIQAVKSEDFLIAKIGAEAIPLLKETDQQEAIVIAFESKISWVCNTTLGACRYLARLSSKNNQSIRRYLRSIPTFDFIERFKDLNFSLSLSEIFQKQRWFIWLDLVELCISLVFFVFLAILLIIICSPVYFIIFSIIIYCIYKAFKLSIEDIEEDIEIPFSSEDIEENIEIPFSSKIPFIRVFICFWIVLLYTEFELVQKLVVVNYSIWSFYFNDMKGIIMPIAVVTIFGWELILLFVKITIKNCKKIDFGTIFSFGEVLNFLVTLVRSLFYPLSLALLMALLIKYEHDLNLLMSLLIKKLTSVIFLITGINILPLLDKIQEFIEKTQEFIEKTQELLLLTSIIILGIVLFFMLLGLLIYEIQKSLEYQKLRKNGLPEKVTCKIVYETCLTYRSLPVRQQYLQNLRLRRILLVGTIEDPPPELLKDKLVAEELAKLREQWYGLSS